FDTDENGVSWITSTGPAHAGRPYRERYHRSMHDLDDIVGDLDKMGLDVAAISPVPPTNPYGMPLETAEKVCDILNRGLSEMARARPDRLVALASVPLQTASGRRRCSNGPSRSSACAGRRSCRTPTAAIWTTRRSSHFSKRRPSCGCRSSCTPIPV